MDDDFKIETSDDGATWNAVDSADTYMFALKKAKALSFGKLARIVRPDLGEVVITLREGMGVRPAPGHNPP